MECNVTCLLRVSIYTLNASDNDTKQIIYRNVLRRICFSNSSRYFFCMTGPAFTVRDPIYWKRDAEIEALKG